MKRRKPYDAPPRFQDLPGWQESFDAALRAKERMPAGHYVSYVGVQALRTVGNMVPPSSIDYVTTNCLLAMAIGVEAYRNDKRRKQEESKVLSAEVIDIREARRIQRLSTPEARVKEFGHDPWEPAEWSIRGTPPWPIKKALSAVRDEEGAAE